MTNFSWLPADLEPAVARLARVDDHIYELGDLAGVWSRSALELRQSRRQDGRFRVTVRSIRPVPPVMALLFSEAVNHLRAVLDNAVWHLVLAHGGALDPKAAKAVSMPIHSDGTKFSSWANDAGRRVPALGTLGSPVRERIAQLQPFNDPSRVSSLSTALASLMEVDGEQVHPLELLQAYSNGDKHRSIRVMAARAIITRHDEPYLPQDRSFRPIAAGMVLAEGIWGTPVPLESSAAVVVERPEPWTAAVAPATEIRDLRDWVRGVALPVLLTGATPPPSELPEAIALDDDGRTLRDRIETADRVPSRSRLQELAAQRLGEAYTAPWAFPPAIEEEFPD